MKFSKKWLFGGLGLFAFAAVAVAQTISVPTVNSLHPTDLFQVIPFGAPQAGNVYATAPQITSQYGYVKASPGTGFSYTFGNSQVFLVLTQGGTIASGTVALAAAPSDGDRNCIWSRGTITSFNMTVGSTQTLNNPVTTLGPTTAACYLYSANNATWDRN